MSRTDLADTASIKVEIAPDATVPYMLELRSRRGRRVWCRVLPEVVIDRLIRRCHFRLRPGLYWMLRGGLREWLVVYFSPASGETRAVSIPQHLGKEFASRLKAGELLDTVIKRWRNS